MKVNYTAVRKINTVSIATGEERELTIKIGAPEVIESSGAFRCFLDLDWLGRELDEEFLSFVSFPEGPDSFSSLQNAMAFEAYLALFSYKYKFYYICNECYVSSSKKIRNISPLTGHATFENVIECRPDANMCDRFILSLEEHLRMYKIMRKATKDASKTTTKKKILCQ